MGNGTLPHNVVFTAFRRRAASARPFPRRRCPTMPAPWSSECRFDAPGIYDFFCTAHGQMVGTRDRRARPRRDADAEPSPTPSRPSPTPSPVADAVADRESDARRRPDADALADPDGRRRPAPAIEAHDNFFQDASQADPADHSVTVAPGETVRFSYPSGSSSHNVNFGDVASAPTCTQTAGPAIVRRRRRCPSTPLPAGLGRRVPLRHRRASTRSSATPTQPEMTGTVVVAEAAGEEPTPVPTATPTPTPTGRRADADADAAPVRARRHAGAEAARVGELRAAARHRLTLARFTAGKLDADRALRLGRARARSRSPSRGRSPAGCKLKSTTLATAKATCDGHGRFTVTVKPSLKVERALAHHRALAQAHGDAQARRPERPDEHAAVAHARGKERS